VTLPRRGSVEDLWLRRGRKWALQGVELELAEAETAAILGPNGAGKTTLLETIMGAHRPDRGLIAVGGALACREPGGPCHPPEKRRAVMVPQDAMLFPGMTVRENIEYAAAHLPPWERRRLAARLAEELGIADILDRKPGQLSGGQRQRAALARALAAEPRLLLLDEPLANIDQASRWRLRRLLKRVTRERGLPTLLVTHSFADAWSLADKVYFMENGRIKGGGPAGELALHPLRAGAANLLGYTVLEAQRDPHNPRLLHVKRLGPLHVADPQPPGRLLVALRPDDPTILSPEASPRENTYHATVLEATVTRHAVRLTVKLGEGLTLETEQPRGLLLAALRKLPKPGDRLKIYIPPEAPDTAPRHEAFTSEREE